MSMSNGSAESKSGSLFCASSNEIAHNRHSKEPTERFELPTAGLQIRSTTSYATLATPSRPASSS